MHDSYMKPMNAGKDVLVEVPEEDAWREAYLHRGWELVEVDGKPMLKYPKEMGTPLVPQDTVPFWNDESPEPRKSRKTAKKRK